MKTLIGIDNGTQSTKVLFFDVEKKEIVATASAPHKLISREDGSREQEASWWIDAAVKAFNQIDDKIKKSAIAVGVSGQQHGFVPLDKDGKVLSPVKLWCDTSTGEQCNTINSRVGGIDEIISKAGNPVYAGYTASKILWLKENHPDIYKKMATILLPHDYLNYVLTGNLVMEYGDASGTALLDVRKRVWSKEVVEALDSDRDLMEALPKLVEAHEPAGYVTKEASKLFGIPQGILVSSGGGDNMIAAIGTGVVSDGVMTMSLGTSGTLYGYSDKPVIDKDGNIAAFCSSTGGYLPLLCTMNCTVSTEIMRKLLSIEVSEIDDIASQSEAGSGGLITLPFFNGERTPNLPNGKGTLVGMDMENVTPSNILRSSMEAAILGMRYGLDSFKKLGFKPKEIILTGGGSKSLVWRQIAADIMNTTIVVTDNSEAGALGAAIQALWALNHKEGGEKDIQKLVKDYLTSKNELRYKPGIDVAKYNEVYKNYIKYLETLSVVFK
ncbi:xylulokinase [Thiospirochaeta perfilievii]|uniref:Xylulose kinase n=1 Tax=Thiospirochaeta perfilievii TaxID=252967 RepID=A0A5C1QAL8_9SPIO|nr:xylulokinase [Thiospirochaeta perfilievii]QEN04388.1 xylulokinase [Thiospirochaeta perfilievii]